MKYCSHCGAQAEDDAVICVKCGCTLTSNCVDPQDKPNTGFMIVSFFFPLLGLILYLVWRNTSPLKAKSCGMCALIGFITGVVIFRVCWVICRVLWGSVIDGFASAGLML